MNSNVSIVRCKSYETELVYSAVKEALRLLGGITKFIRPKSRVLIKPNLLLPVEPNQAITTHPEVVRAIVKILKEIDCKLFLGDSPTAWIKSSEDFNLLYRKTGIYDIAIQEDVKLVRFDNPFWLKNFALTGWLKECDYLVSLPKFKTHNLTILTGAIKNLFGLVCGKYKLELHKRYTDEKSFSNMLLDIYDLIKPALTVVDGIIS
ncbi:MAG: DUF362 domain-containing protein, partial [Candidatus Omnitrophica bacterium]|nr:DUF362 domain-containing protein [Candidatus Omnitrophota bacterium]